MREQLEQYVNLLFAGSLDAEDMRQEILQNTLDRYDDLIGQGKSPEAAYRLAIAGIGDISELLGNEPSPAPKPVVIEISKKKGSKKQQRAVAIGMYIASAIPLIALGHIGNGTLGLCMTLLLVAAATVLMILSASGSNGRPQAAESTHPAYRAYKSLSGAVTLAVYLLVSFWTQAWHLTWLVFLIAAAIDGIVRAIFDLKEAKNHEA